MCIINLSFYGRRWHEKIKCIFRVFPISPFRLKHADVRNCWEMLWNLYDQAGKP